MPTEEQMTVNERGKYLKLMKPRYQKAERAERSRLLMEMEKVTGLHCKSPPRLLHASSLNRKKRTTRKGPERANQVRKEVPMKRIAWNTTEPGHVEVDLVHHGGESTAGEHGHTIQMVDVATGWSERVAVLGRGQTAMEGGFRRILERIPFPLLEVHPDNGSEFFNQHLVRFWKDTVTGVHLSRSRPYEHVELRTIEVVDVQHRVPHFEVTLADGTHEVRSRYFRCLLER